MSRMIGDTIVKDPQSKEPQGVDWTEWLAEIGPTVTITNSTYELSAGADEALTLSGPTIVVGAKKTQVVLEGGTLGESYRVTNHITTSLGNEADGSFLVLVEST